MYCIYCGKKLPPNANYCPYCGKKINFGIDQGNVPNDDILQKQTTILKSEETNVIKDSATSSCQKITAQKGKFITKASVNYIFERYFTVAGRIGRKDYFIRILIVNIIAFVEYLLTSDPFINLISEHMALFIPMIILSILVFFFGLAATGQRLHDLGHSAGWTGAIFALCVIFWGTSILVTIYLSLKKGQPGKNKYDC